jgi:hypothetical protein
MNIVYMSDMAKVRNFSLCRSRLTEGLTEVLIPVVESVHNKLRPLNVSDATILHMSTK